MPKLERQMLASLFRMLWNRMVPQPEPGARSKLVARVTVRQKVTDEAPSVWRQGNQHGGG